MLEIAWLQCTGPQPHSADGAHHCGLDGRPDRVSPTTWQKPSFRRQQGGEAASEEDSGTLVEPLFSGQPNLSPWTHPYPARHSARAGPLSAVSARQLARPQLHRGRRCRHRSGSQHLVRRRGPGRRVCHPHRDMGEHPRRSGSPRHLEKTEPHHRRRGEHRPQRHRPRMHGRGRGAHWHGRRRHGPGCRRPRAVVAAGAVVLEGTQIGAGDALGWGSSPAR